MSHVTCHWSLWTCDFTTQIRDSHDSSLCLLRIAAFWTLKHHERGQSDTDMRLLVTYNKTAS